VVANSLHQVFCLASVVTAGCLALEDVDVIGHRALPDSSEMLTILSLVHCSGICKNQARQKTGLIFGSPGRTAVGTM